jgi:hypothetical protein
MRPTRAVRVAGLGTSSPRGLALRSPRGALVAASAKKGKKSAPEPVYEDDEDDEDDEETGWDDDEDVDDDEETEIGSASAADGEEDEEEEDEETGDASELMPPKSTGSVSSKKSGKKKKSKSLVVEEEETGNAFGTAVGYVQDAVANPAIRNLGILGFSILAGSFALVRVQRVHAVQQQQVQAQAPGEQERGGGGTIAGFLPREPRFAQPRTHQRVTGQNRVQAGGDFSQVRAIQAQRGTVHERLRRGRVSVEDGVRTGRRDG